jgi:hypothetical protein
MTLQSQMYDCETWNVTRTNARRMEAVEMKFLRYVAGYTLWDKKRSK